MLTFFAKKSKVYSSRAVEKHDYEIPDSSDVLPIAVQFILNMQRPKAKLVRHCTNFVRFRGFKRCIDPVLCDWRRRA